MVICLDKDTLSCLARRRKIERALWVIWIELGLSGCNVGLSCIIYTRNSGLPVRDRSFENFRKSKYRSKFLIWFSGITHQRVSFEKLWAIRKKLKLSGDSRWLQKVVELRVNSKFQCSTILCALLKCCHGRDEFRGLASWSLKKSF